MIYAILFEDDPIKKSVRALHMDAHRAFLERNARAIIAAGPLLQGDGLPTGGLWIVEAPDEDTARALVEEDPFWPTGLRKSVSVLAWKQVFAEGAWCG